ncbi:MAG: hypothetical protein QMD82_06885 [bacterium]|nr:hypothetical protein [bacterium]
MDILKIIKRVPDYFSETNGNIVQFVIFKYYRNLDGYKFPYKLSVQELNQIRDKVSEVAKELPMWENNYSFVEIQQVAAELSMILYERGILGAEGLQRKDVALIFDESERHVMRINERDHIKLIFRGAYSEMHEIGEESQIYAALLDKTLNFAFKEGVGYLTSSPRYLGHALSISALVHVPAIFLLGQIQNFSQILQKNLIVLSGLMDTVIQTYGAFVQIKITSFFDTFNETKTKMASTLEEIVELENQLRNLIYADRPLEVEDRIYKSYAILRSAKLLSLVETYEHLSNLRIGVDLGYVKEIHPGFFNEVFFRILPYHIKVYYGVSEDDLNKEAEMRALLIQELLDKYHYEG